MRGERGEVRGSREAPCHQAPSQHTAGQAECTVGHVWGGVGEPGGEEVAHRQHVQPNQETYHVACASASAPGRPSLSHVFAMRRTGYMMAANRKPIRSELAPASLTALQ